MARRRTRHGARRRAAGVTARLAPLLLVFAVVWPLTGFPWWPLVLVLELAVVLRVLGFGYLLAGKRGPGCSSGCWW